MAALRNQVGERRTLAILVGQPSLVRLLPALAAGVYPFLLRAFHALVGPPAANLGLPEIISAGAILGGVFCIPILGLICAAMPGQAASTRRLAYVSVTAPTVYVFLGVVQSIIRSSIPDEMVWCALWTGAAVLAELGRSNEPVSDVPLEVVRWRVAHGIAGSVILIYVLFHVTNHLFGLIGPEAHAAIMNIGRRVYRAPVVEPLLVLMMFFQIGSGLYLAWRWSGVPQSFHRLIQVASGFYLSVFILGHMNSVFIYARTVLDIPTDWKFATGAPNGIIHDPWNIRLLPHYALGVFFVLTHLVSGLRVVAIAHGVSPLTASRLWSAGSAASTLIAVAIIAGMCGIRL